MTGSESAAELAAAKGPSAGATRGWRAEELLLGALLLLSLAGIAIADFSAQSGFTYWLYMVPVFAAASIFSGWTRARRLGQGIARILTQHALHWAPLPVALYVVYRLQVAGRLNREDAGLVALLVVSLTTFLAGVHFDWRLAVVGVLLTAATVCAALVEEFFWVLLLPALLVGGLVILWRRGAAGAPPGRSDPG